MHLQQHLLTQDGFVNVQVIEPILRRYQVFPGRTHPYMNGTAGGGFLLSATHVFSNDQTVSANLRVKRKAEDKPSEENKRAKPDMTEIAQDNTGADAEGNTVEK